MKKNLLKLVALCLLTTAAIIPINAQSGPNSTPITQWTSGGFEIRNPSGSVLLGPLNTGWCHMYTDRPAFIFNKPVHAIGGAFSSYYLDNLYLQTGGATRMTILNSSGNVGIGTTNPLETLHVNGNVLIPTNYWLHLGNRNDATSGFLGILASNSYNVYADFPRGSIYFRNPNGAVLGIQGNRTVTINYQETYDNTVVDTKGHALAVNGGIMAHSFDVDGKINCQEVEVKPNIWNDVVFDKDYKLMSLTELETYINTHKHLPSVPSDAEVKEKGIKVGEMNAILLGKIEELTRYVIELKKEVEELKKK